LSFKDIYASRNDNFEKFAKNMQSLGMPASAGILYNNMHNRSVFDKVYDIAVANGLDLDKETLIQKIGIGEIKDDYQILDSKGIKVKPTTPKPTLAPKVVAPTTPTTTLKDFTIPSIQQGIATKKELNLSPSPTKSEVVVEDRPIPKVPQLSDIKPIENFSLPTNLPTQTDYRGANFKQPTFDIEPAYSKLSIDDVIADNNDISFCLSLCICSICSIFPSLAPIIWSAILAAFLPPTIFPINLPIGPPKT